MSDPQWTGFIEALRERLTAAAQAGRTVHLEKWNLGRTGGAVPGDPGPAAGVDAAGGIQLAESLGWTLLDAGYVHVPQYQQSHALTDSAYVLGSVWGMYLFKHG